jgi:NADH-quinone oxidoreductase subunit M
MLVDGAIQASPYLGLAVVAAAALNGIAVVRAYFYLFTGARHTSAVSLRIGPREQMAVLTLVTLILCGGFFPQPGIASRHRAATTILQARQERRHQHVGIESATTMDDPSRLVISDSLPERGCR